MSIEVLTYTDVAVGVQAATAEYAQSLDAGQVDEVVALFTVDGVFEITGSGGPAEGADALREAFGGFLGEKPLRHVMINTLVGEWNSIEASATSDLLVLARGDAGWALEMVGKYQDELRLVDGRWLFHSRKLTFA